jgi:hypothetical protein
MFKNNIEAVRDIEKVFQTPAAQIGSEFTEEHSFLNVSVCACALGIR